jgi:cyclopropane fatty-acyl-phospholipid synthase-like methyltransferase
MYEDFAGVYDRLMDDFDYPAWADYYLTLLKRHGVTVKTALEAGCGTGSMSVEFARRRIKLVSSDLSENMLHIAQQKARKNGVMIPFVQQDMRFLQSHRPVDAVMCCCDGVNYLTEPEDVKTFFRAAMNALKPGGALAFDISSRFKLRDQMGSSFFGEERDDVAYLWQNRYHPQQKYVELNLAIFVRQQDETYTRIGEYQKQYVHEAAEIFDLLKTVGFERIGLFGDKRMEAPREQENRWFITARKPFLPKE